MNEPAPRSWRSILFRPGRPPLRRRTAVLLCAAFLLLNIVLDVVLLTNSRVLGRVAEIQIRKHAGDLVDFEKVSLTLGGKLHLDAFRLRLPDPANPVLTARRVRVSIGHREGGFVAESVILDDPRIRLTDRIARSLEGDPAAPKRPLNELISPGQLPRISCRGGTLELGHSAVLAGEEPQVFEILDLAMVPTTGYRYFVRGSLRNAVVGEWNVQGEVDLESGDHRVYLTNEQLALGPGIREALKSTIHDVWDKYQPSGPAGVEVILVRDLANPAGGFRATLKPKGMRLVYRNFPIACEDVRGEIEFRADGFTIKKVDARNGKSARIRLDGSADGYEADAGYHFRIEMDDMSLDESLRKSLKKDAQDVWAQFKPAGKIDARGTIHRERGGPEVKESLPVDLHFKGAAFTYSGFPYLIDKATGEVRIDGENVIIKRLQGRHGPAEFTIAGRIDSIATDSVIDLDVRAVSLELDGRLRDALAPESRQAFDRIGASGQIDLDVRLLRSKGGEPRIRAVAHVKDNRVLFRDAPLPVRLTEGTVEVSEGRVRLHNLKGQLDPTGEIEVNGEIVTDAEGTRTHIEVDGMTVPIDDRFRDRMPKSVGEVLRSLQLTGLADFKFTLDERPERDKPATRVRLNLDLRKGVVSASVPVEDIDGTLVIVGPIRDGRPTLSGRLDVRSARIVKKLVKNLRTNITIQGSSLDFRDISGDAYGGKISGSFALDTVTNDLEGDFTVSRLDLHDFVNDTATWSGKTIAGKVDLRIPGLKGKANDLASLKSGEEGCSLTITEGDLLDVPGIITFLNPLQSRGRFTAMKAFFDIYDAKFKIKEFAFLGKEGAGSVYGKGDFWFNGKFKLKVSTSTGSIFGIPFFIASIPGALFDLLKSPLKLTVEGDLESSKMLEE